MERSVAECNGDGTPVSTVSSRLAPDGAGLIAAAIQFPRPTISVVAMAGSRTTDVVVGAGRGIGIVFYFRFPLG